MNEQQFNIVKTMQAVGVPAQKFANACNVDTILMHHAYASASYQQFATTGPNGDLFGSIFEGLV